MPAKKNQCVGPTCTECRDAKVLCSLSKEAKKNAEPAAGPSSSPLYNMFHRLERQVQANTEALDRVVGALNALEKTIKEAKESVDGEEEEEDEADKGKSDKAKGKRRQK